jgi:hypothetical protein
MPRHFFSKIATNTECADYSVCLTFKIEDSLLHTFVIAFLRLNIAVIVEVERSFIRTYYFCGFAKIN